MEKRIIDSLEVVEIDDTVKCEFFPETHPRAVYCNFGARLPVAQAHRILIDQDAKKDMKKLVLLSELSWKFLNERKALRTFDGTANLQDSSRKLPKSCKQRSCHTWLKRTSLLWRMPRPMGQVSNIAKTDGPHRTHRGRHGKLRCNWHCSIPVQTMSAQQEQVEVEDVTRILQSNPGGHPTPTRQHPEFLPALQVNPNIAWRDPLPPTFITDLHREEPVNVEQFSTKLVFTNPQRRSAEYIRRFQEREQMWTLGSTSWRGEMLSRSGKIMQFFANKKPGFCQQAQRD